MLQRGLYEKLFERGLGQRKILHCRTSRIIELEPHRHTFSPGERTASWARILQKINRNQVEIDMKTGNQNELKKKDDNNNNNNNNKTRQTHEPECNRYERMSTTLVNDCGINNS